MSDDDGRGAVAQGSEQGAHNASDVGSSPTGPTDAAAAIADVERLRNMNPTPIPVTYADYGDPLYWRDDLDDEDEDEDEELGVAVEPNSSGDGWAWCDDCGDVHPEPVTSYDE